MTSPAMSTFHQILANNLIANITSGNLSAIQGGTSIGGSIRGNLIGLQRSGLAGLVNVASTTTTPIATTPRAIFSRVATAPGDEILDNVRRIRAERGLPTERET